MSISEGPREAWKNVKAGHRSSIHICRPLGPIESAILNWRTRVGADNPGYFIIETLTAVKETRARRCSSSRSFRI
jgi:ABC-type protease/lipase transport system fused ATPase/permease subunit